jgi:formate hydrogenlyase subunit 6/NADH:ubiquinone oxidoreductase subunit I
MTAQSITLGTKVVIQTEALEQLIALLKQQGHEVVGPTIRDGAIVYDRIESLQDLPVGWTEEQEAGRYRLKRRGDQAFFGYTVGPQSWKRFLHPPTLRLFQTRQTGAGLDIEATTDSPPRYAFIGVRACELAAIAIQDRVFMGDRYVDPAYQGRREDLFILAVNCTQAAPTCFCTSMQTGPEAQSGFDLSLTELLTEGSHRFLIEVGSDRGAELLAKLDYSEAGSEAKQQAEAGVERARSMIQRRLDTDGIRDLLYNNSESSRWDQIASRCLTCANCTMVCPTCFCTSVEDVTDLAGVQSERWRKWDSCFTTDFSYIHGGSIRTSSKSRYRQWMTHKLATWIDQFGTSGCVGCGRCITWCPVGIDITEEVQGLRTGETGDASDNTPSSMEGCGREGDRSGDV